MEFKLLVVDDEKEAVGSLSAVFTARGYQVLQAGSGDEALAILSREPVDLAVLDLNMPGISGIDVLRHVKAKIPQTKVLVITGYPEREPEARQSGCDGFIRKPFAIGDLIEQIHSLLTRKDDDELKSVTMGLKILEADPGEPLAMLLLFEPNQTMAKVLLKFLGNAHQVEGSYRVELSDSIEKTLDILLSIHPDIVLMDLIAVQEPAEAVKRLLSCGVQPKDYIFYTPPRTQGKDLPSDLPGKRWEGSPWKGEDLNVLAQLIRKTAQEHDLVKR